MNQPRGEPNVPLTSPLYRRTVTLKIPEKIEAGSKSLQWLDRTDSGGMAPQPSQVTPAEAINNLRQLIRDIEENIQPATQPQPQVY